MNDRERFGHLLARKHACISIVSHEEDYSLGIIREAAVEVGRELWLWNIVDGVRDGLLANSVPVKDTENPAGALY